MSNVTSNATRAGLEYRNAVVDAGNFIDQLFAQSGWKMPDGAGGYSTTASGDAFDPDKVIQFDDRGVASYKMPGAFGLGQYGTTGSFARSAQETATEEAEARQQSLQSGIRGGLARQREQLSETLGIQRMGDISNKLIQDILSSYGNVRGAYLGTLTGGVEDTAGAAGAQAEVAPVAAPPKPAEPPLVEPTPVKPPPVESSPVETSAQKQPVQYNTGDIVEATNRGNFDTKGSPGGTPPKNPQPGQVFKGERGVTWVWRPQGPNGPGWYKRSK
jgi:hypothetical protein